MPLDIDGAGRSRSLACLPTARGTVAPTRGQVPGGVLLGADPRKNLGSAAPNFSPPEKHVKTQKWDRRRRLQGLEGFPGASRGLQDPGTQASRGLAGASRGVQGRPGASKSLATDDQSPQMPPLVCRTALR